jgi:uncharacterized membrane protein
MLREFIGQAIGVVSIAGWLGMTVYFMSRTSATGATDSGNWFVGYVVFTLIFIAIMVYWGRFFRTEA